MQIHELSDEMTSIADAGTYLAVDNGVVTSKIDYLRLAKAIIEAYNGSQINGSNQTLQAAIAGLQGEIDDVYIDATSLSSLYSQIVAAPLTKPILFRVDGSVSSSLTNGDVTVTLKGIIIKMDAQQNICDIIASDGSGYIHMIRDKFASASEVVVQTYKGTKALENSINTLIKTKTVTGTTSDGGFIASGTVGLTGKTIISVVPSDGQYVAIPYAGNGVLVYNRAMTRMNNLSVTLNIAYVD